MGISEMTGAAPAALLPLSSGGNRPALFLMHPSGGSSVPYVPLARRLDPDQPAYGIDAAELGQGPLTAGLEEMIGGYLAQVLAAQPASPYHLAGWSVGGAFALGLAAALRDYGADVGALVLLDAFGWEAEAGEPDPVDLLLQFADSLADTAGTPLPPLEAATLRAVPPEQRFTVVLAALIESGAASASAEGLIRQRLAAFTAIMTALHGWTPPRYDGRIDLLCAADGPGAKEAGFWSAVTTGPVVVHEVPGDHYTMMQPPHVSVTASQLQNLLDQAVADRFGHGRDVHADH